jgi:hypothetical protein
VSLPPPGAAASPPRTQAALLVLEAQLSVLLALTSAGGPLAQRSSTKQVADAEALPILTSCKCVRLSVPAPVCLCGKQRPHAGVCVWWWWCVRVCVWGGGGRSVNHVLNHRRARPHHPATGRSTTRPSSPAATSA